MIYFKKGWLRLAMKWVHKYISLSSQSRTLLIQAFLWLSLIHVGLRVIPLRHLHSVVKWAIANATHQKPSDEIQIENIIWAIETATSYVPGHPKCLARALSTKILMHQYGYPCNLQVGVAKDRNAGLSAHAWIEHDGQVLIGGGRDLASFTPLPSIYP